MGTESTIASIDLGHFGNSVFCENNCPRLKSNLTSWYSPKNLQILLYKLLM